MKVLHVIEELSSHGGTPRKLLYLTRGSRITGLSHAFVTFARGDLEPAIRDEGCNIYPATSASIPAIVRSVARAIESEQPAVVNTHFSRSLFCTQIANLETKLPIVHHAHGPAIANQNSNIGRGVKVAVVRKCLERARLVTANSRFTAETLGRIYHVRPDRMRVIYNPVEKRIDTVRSCPPLPPLDPNVLRITHVGGLIPVRDQATLVRGLAEIAKFDVPAELLMIGEGTLRSELQTLSERLGVAAQIHWLGYRQDIAAILATTHIYANACKSEGFGIAVVEAMLHGVPALVADRGAHQELIEHQSTGLLFKAGDASDFARHAVNLWRSAGQRQRLIAAARRTAEERFAPRLYAEKFAAVMREANRGHP